MVQLPCYCLFRQRSEEDHHGVTRSRLSGVRCRQPHVRDDGRADEVHAARVQGSDRLRRSARAHEDRGQGQDQQLHPKPDLQRGRATRRMGAVLSRGKPGREVHSRDDGATDPDTAGVLRARGTSEADGRPGTGPSLDVADARQPHRGALARRSVCDPGRRHVAEPLDARALVVQRRRPHLPYTSDQSHGPGSGDRRIGMGHRARRAHLSHAPGAGPHCPRVEIDGVAGVRSVLGARRRSGHGRRVTFLRQRIHALHQRVGRHSRW